MKTLDEYEDLTTGEVRRLAEAGDALAKQILEEMHSEIRQMALGPDKLEMASILDDAPPNSLMALLRDIDRFKANGDLEA